MAITFAENLALRTRVLYESTLCSVWDIEINGQEFKHDLLKILDRTEKHNIAFKYKKRLVDTDTLPLSTQLLFYMSEVRHRLRYLEMGLEFTANLLTKSCFLLKDAAKNTKGPLAFGLYVATALVAIVSLCAVALSLSAFLLRAIVAPKSMYKHLMSDRKTFGMASVLYQKLFEPTIHHISPVLQARKTARKNKADSINSNALKNFFNITQESYDRRKGDSQNSITTTNSTWGTGSKRLLRGISEASDNTLKTPSAQRQFSIPIADDAFNKQSRKISATSDTSSYYIADYDDEEQTQPSIPPSNPVTRGLAAISSAYSYFFGPSTCIAPVLDTDHQHP